MRIKRFLATTLGTALVAGVVFTGCGSKKDDADKADSTTVAEVTAEGTETTAEGTDANEKAEGTEATADGNEADEKVEVKSETEVKEEEKSADKKAEKTSDNKKEEKASQKNTDKSESAEKETVDAVSENDSEEETEEVDEDRQVRESVFSERGALVRDKYSDFDIEFTGGDFYIGNYKDIEEEAYAEVTPIEGEDKLHFVISIDKSENSIYEYTFDASIAADNPKYLEYDNCTECIVTFDENYQRANTTVVAENLSGDIIFETEGKYYEWYNFDEGFPGFIFECVDFIDWGETAEYEEPTAAVEIEEETYDYDDDLEWFFEERVLPIADSEFDYTNVGSLTDANTFIGEFVDEESKGKLVATKVAEDDSKVHISIQAEKTPTSYYKFEYDVYITGDEYMPYENYVEIYGTTAADEKGASEAVINVDKGGTIRYLYGGDTFIWEYFKHDLPGFIFEKVSK